jgi:hypothetical protein
MVRKAASDARAWMAAQTGDPLDLSAKTLPCHLPGVVVGYGVGEHFCFYAKRTRNGRNAAIELTGKVPAAGTPADLPSIAQCHSIFRMNVSHCRLQLLDRPR